MGLRWCLLLVAVVCLDNAEAGNMKRVYRYTNHVVPPWFDDRPSFSFVIDEGKSLVITSLGEIAEAEFCKDLKNFFCVRSAIINVAVPVCSSPRIGDKWAVGGVDYVVRSAYQLSILNSRFEVQKIEFAEKNHRGFILFNYLVGVVGFYEEEGSDSDRPEGELYLIEGADGFGACPERKQ